MESYVEQGAGADSIEQIGFGGARRTKKKHRGLTVFQLKVIGTVALALSAGSTTIVPLFFGSDVNNMTSLTAMVLSEVVSWFAIPIYAWLLVQGYRETHSRVAYGLQLFILAVVCEVPYDLCTSHKAFDFGSQNPVFGLFIAFVVLAVLDWVAARYQKSMKIVLSVGLVLIGLLWDLLLRDGLRQHENSMMFTAGLFGAVMMIMPGIGVAFVHYYNGELGYKRQWTKWAFYAAYPVILIFCAIGATLA